MRTELEQKKTEESGKRMEHKGTAAEITPRVKIKICGLRRREDILAVNAVLPDYCGFIIEFPKSFRSVTGDQVRELVRGLDHQICPVGVFVNASEERVAELLNEGTIAMTQLHGQEDEAYIQRLRALTDRPLIRAFSVKTADDVQRAQASSADFILLDQGGGGTGIPFDWSLVPRLSRPFFLAGGLGEDNLAEAIQRLKPYAVDLSSSVETDRWKDPEKIRRVVEIIKNGSSA